ncbi:MAG: hypothetical protein V3U02_12405 [Calditrichia bacterium]
MTSYPHSEPKKKRGFGRTEKVCAVAPKEGYTLCGGWGGFCGSRMGGVDPGYLGFGSVRRGYRVGLRITWGGYEVRFNG